MKFIIEEKHHELTEGYLMLIIKYSVVLLLAWMIGILIVFTYPCFAWSGNKYPPMLVSINDYNIINILLSIIGIYVYSKRLFKQVENGLLIEIDFNEKEIHLTIMNTLNGKIREVCVPNTDFKVISQIKKSSLYGNQRIYDFYQKNLIITSLNLDLTAWKRSSQLDSLIQKLENYNQ